MLNPGSEPQLPGSHKIIIVNSTYSTVHCVCFSPFGVLLITLLISYRVLCFVSFYGWKEMFPPESRSIYITCLCKQGNKPGSFNVLFIFLHFFLFYVSEFYPHALCEYGVSGDQESDPLK